MGVKEFANGQEETYLLNDNLGTFLLERNGKDESLDLRICVFL